MVQNCSSLLERHRKYGSHGKGSTGGGEGKGAEAVLLAPDEFVLSKWSLMMQSLLSPWAMGAEVLEEDEFEPMFASCEAKLLRKKELHYLVSWWPGETERWMETGRQDVKRRSCLNLRKRDLQ